MNSYLSLKGLDYELNLVKEDRYNIYYNKDNNVTIFALNLCPTESINDVFNAITEDAYMQLIDFMNTHNDLIVYWTKVEGVTSDYTIYCNCNYDGDWNIVDLYEYLWLLREGEECHFKYVIVQDTEMVKFETRS